MHFICSTSALRAKYGTASTNLLGEIHKLGNMLDVSGQSPEQIRASIAKLPKADAACLVGGYDLIPPFVRPNPTSHLFGDDDGPIPTDAPYGAKPGKAAEEYAPSRAVSRIPDGARVDSEGFSAILAHQLAAPNTPTPRGSFEQAAQEFKGALGYVHGSIPGAKGAEPRFSPPDNVSTKGLTARLSQQGRIHILLHGADFSPDWSYLWGHDGHPSSRFIKALSAHLLDLCDLRGSMVTFSSCYAAMLDVAPAHSGARTVSNQVALACIAHGAKAVFAATRSNWIGTQAPYDAFGPRLVREVWKNLAAGKPAAEALRLAKRTYLKTALSSPSDRPYALKTVLQAQCYGHPAATL